MRFYRLFDTMDSDYVPVVRHRRADLMPMLRAVQPTFRAAMRIQQLNVPTTAEAIESLLNMPPGAMPAGTLIEREWRPTARCGLREVDYADDDDDENVIPHPRRDRGEGAPA